MASVLDQMLAAAAMAAGANWNSVRGDAEIFAKNLIRDSEQIAKDFAAGNIDGDDVKTDLKMLGDYADIVKNYLEDAVKAAAQAAFNAAIDVLWGAITTVAKL